MRTTVTIDDDLLKRVKQVAADEDKTVSDLLNEALRERLARQPRARKTRWEPVTYDRGKLQPGVDLSDNAGLRDLMDQS